MLRSAVLVGSLASVAFGAVANFCVEQPYRGMQEFRDYEPAMSRCAAHYPTETITKMLPNTCLTTTMTIILGTSTVHATNHVPCPTVHLEMRDEDHLEKRDEHDLEARAPKGPTAGGPKRGGPTGGGPKKGGPTGGGPKKGGPTGAGPKHGGATGAGPKHGGATGVGPKKGGPTGKGPTKGGPTGKGPTKGGPTRTLPTSEYPGPTHQKRDAAPTQAVHAKRDAKSSEWNQYYASLVECGYDCVQTACSCVASPRVVLQTPAPTCISTSTKVTVVHETKTLDVAPEQC